MSEDAEETGRLTAYKNKEHEPGSKLPAFKGTITLEGSSEKRQVALWAKKSIRTGKTYFSGKVSETAAEQIDKLTEAPASAENDEAEDNDQAVAPHRIKLWPDQNKTPGSNQKDYYGTYNPGDGRKLQRLDVWAKSDKFGKPMLSGPVTEQKPKKELEQTQEPSQQQAKTAKKKQRAMSM